MKQLVSIYALLLAGVWLLVSTTAFAHEGEDHSHAAAQPVLTTALEPRLEAVSRDVELLAILQGNDLLIYLDWFATNEPLNGASLTVEAAGASVNAVAVGEGLYQLSGINGLNAPGQHELVFTIEGPNVSDVLIGALTAPADSAPSTTAVTGSHTHYLLLGGAGLIGLLMGLMLHRRRSPPLAVLIMLLAMNLSGASALAHEGEDHSADKSPAVSIPAGSAPARLADGSLFVPKPVQRLLNIRTVLAEVRDIPKALELNGHLIADPNRSGRVQATQAGRLEPATEGLPHLGQSVRAGQVLAYLIPVAATLETANQQAQLAELNSQINLAERRLARLQQLTGSVAKRDIEEARTELEGLRKRRAAVSNGLSLREPLRAPVDGVISSSFAVAGQVVEARETLFEIIDPRQWWVEAVVYDAGLDEQIHSAVAQTFDAQLVMPVRVLGMGYQRRSQGLPLQFKIEGEFPNLSAGQPVRILAQTRETLSGVALPRDSVVRSSGSETLVWIHTSAERFTPRTVRAQAVDGATLVVTEGLNPGERVVSTGAALLAQVR